MLQAELGTLVTYNPLALSGETTLADVLSAWNAVDDHHWPVVDDDQCLIGILSVGDVIRCVQELAATVPDNHQLDRELLATRTAREMMSTELVTITRRDNPAHALQLLLAHRVLSLPVVENERVVGMVTTTDFLREFSYGHVAASRQPAMQHVEESFEPIDCDATLDEAVEAMRMAGAEHVGVVRGQLPLGVVTRRDVRLAKYRLDTRRVLSDEFTLPGPATIHELVAQSPVLSPGARLSEAAELMVAHRRQAIAVVNQAGRLVGIISESGILRAMEGTPTCPHGIT
jgi:CBS domain-containing protein